MRRALPFTSLFILLLSGCAPKQSAPAACSGVTCSGAAETGYCSTPITYSSNYITVTGTAKYHRREVYSTGATDGLGSADPLAAVRPASVNPIRAAEIRVTDAAGNVVQCAQTSESDGSFSFRLPQAAATYTVSVNSRADNMFMRASVLDAPATNQHYSLTSSIAGDSSPAALDLVARADGEILGAAFNILDQIFAANAYLQAQVGTCSFTGCTSVPNASVIPKVYAYWKKGFNPNAYFGSNNGLSFYLPGYSRLFILGGVNGNTNTADTDHFDNSVIIHEYAHFLEDVMFASDSPGGSHNGNGVIDPRLAWSEGWGNYFQAAVRGEKNYRDSVGNDDGTTYLAFDVDIEDAGVSLDAPDIPTALGEGNFREFAVARFLWDATDTVADSAAESFRVAVGADSGGSLNGKYFYFSSPDNDYLLYLDNGSATAPSIAGRTNVQVTYTDDDSGTTIAGLIASAIDSLPDFTASSSGAIVTATALSAGGVNDARDAGHTGFTFSTDVQGRNDDINSGSQFAQIWASLTKSTRGFRDPAFAFRNVGHLNLAQTWLFSNAGGSNWENIRATNGVSDTTEYARFVTTGSTCADYVIDPIPQGSSSYAASNLFYNNDFYHLRITGAGSYTVRLEYVDADGAGTKADLDLYVYNESGRFAVSSDLLGSSFAEPNANIAATETETVTLSMSAGHYLINVNAYVGEGRGQAGPTNYKLYLNGSPLCPSNLVQ